MLFSTLAFLLIPLIHAEDIDAETFIPKQVVSTSANCKPVIYTSWENRVKGGTNNPGWNIPCSNSLTSDFAKLDAMGVTQQAPSCWTNNPTGPQPVGYPVATIPTTCNKVQWMKNRFLSVIQKIVNMQISYCHYHTPFFVATKSPQKQVGNCNVNAQGKWQGLDCSNFASFVYNYGFGGKMISDIAQQACQPGTAPGKVLNVSISQINQLQTGDLLYIAGAFYKKPNGNTNITHVILWTGFKANLTGGVTAKSSDPLHISNLVNNLPTWQKKDSIIAINKAIQLKQDVMVIADAHGNSVNYRPFVAWYAWNFSHARRMIQTPQQDASQGLLWKDGECFGRPVRWWSDTVVLPSQISA